MKKNPYILVFGKEPLQYISRTAQMIEIQESFQEEPATQQTYMIVGIRGSGKTVFMTEVAKTLAEEDDGWIHVELSSAGDLLFDFAAALTSENQLAQIFQKAKLNLSLFGIGLEVDNSVPISSIQTAITKMLESIKKHRKKVLVCIDEVTVTEAMIKFTSAFQIFVRQDLPIFLLMTGLYENINNLQNEKSLTFLYRAPKIELKPLNLLTVAGNYKKIFRLDENAAMEMASITRGYSFAFQVLGHYTYRHDGDYQEALPEVRQYLEEYVYEKIWSEMSLGDRKLAYGVAMTESGKAKDIREFLSLADNEYSPYRNRLVKRGILDGSTHGVVKFTLPLFEDYVKRKYLE